MFHEWTYVVHDCTKVTILILNVPDLTTRISIHHLHRSFELSFTKFRPLTAMGMPGVSPPGFWGSPSPTLS